MRSQSSGWPWRAWRTAIKGQGLWPWTGASVPRGRRAARPARGAGRRTAAGRRAIRRRRSGRRAADGSSASSVGSDADPATAQLPGDVGRAVFVGEQLPRGEDQGRAFADVVAKAGQRRRVGARADRSVGEREQRAAGRGEQVQPGDRAAQQRQDDDQRRQRRADLDRLGGGVGSAAEPGRGVGKRRGGEAGDQRRLAAAPAEHQPVEQQDRGEGGAERSSRAPAPRRRRG